MKRLCSICARGGSKGLKNKNILPMLGEPLIAHTIRHMKESGIFDAIAVSSDSKEILDISRSLGVDFLINRPEDLASDIAAKIPAIRHCAEEVERMSGIKFETFTDLDCTSPLRIIEDVVNAVEYLEKNDYDNIFSVNSSRRSPYFDIVELDEMGFVKPCKKLVGEYTRRQDTPLSYDLNASIYVWNRETLMHSDSLYNKKTGLFIMPVERSVEIDGELEFLFVELLMKRQKRIE